MSDDTIIRIEGLWKRYGLPLPAFVRQGHRWLRSLRDSQNPKAQTPNPKSEIRNPKSSDGPWALRDIDLEVKRGETLGIIGRNGAGKSTLLKVLAGVTPPTRGKVEVRGRVFPMIELNAGLHMELTGRENVYLLGAVMGLTRAETEAKMKEIEEFCELGEWFDRPVRKYSSGMLARLGFGVAMNVDAEILLIDEVLAVGDLAFQRRCYNRIENLREKDVATIFVSHNIRQVERICDRVVLLEEGQTTAVGNGEAVLHLYVEQAHERILTQKITEAGGIPRAAGTGDLRVAQVQVLNVDHLPSQELSIFEDMTVHLELEVVNPICKPVIAFQIYSVDMICVAAINNTGTVRPSFESGRVVVECTLSQLRLMPGIYSLCLKIRDGNEALILTVDQLAQFRVTGQSFGLIRTSGGFVHVEANWRFGGSQKQDLSTKTGDIHHA